jgi:hypothetical protein
MTESLKRMPPGVKQSRREPAANNEITPTTMDADLRGSYVAIQRAARQARLLAVQTGTDLIVFRQGQIVRVSPKDIDLS